MPEGGCRSAGDLFVDALELPAAERARWLDDACAGDPVLRAEVESLLSAHGEAGDFLAEPAIDTDLDVPGIEKEDLSGSRIGAYRLVKPIGAGGMSTVYLGERAEAEFEQRVAVKLIKRGMDADHILSRFTTERRVLASLEHPHIARLVDGGAAPDGRPYLVMEFVDGLPIDRFCEDRQLSVPARLELFRTVCAAVQHAHQNLVVHRDLKPSNILVTEDGTVKLLDFGIAKVLQPDDDELAVGLTATMLRMMTPRYASPEQIRGEPVTTATDVYSLGVLLYELLTGKPPYEFERTAPGEVERVICHTEPTRPSAVVASAGRLSRTLSGDLDNIVLKALRKEPERRYQPAEQLSEDLRRHGKGLPVRARPDTLRYRSAKFVRRNLRAMVAAALVFAALVAATAVSTRLYLRSERALAEADTQRRTAARVSEFLQGMMVAVDPVETQRGEPVTVDRILAEAVDRLDDELADEPEVAAALHGTIAETYIHLGRLTEARTQAEAALALWDRTDGPASARTAAARVLLGRILLAGGDPDAAEPLFRGALAAAMADAGGDGALAATALRKLAETKDAQGDYEEAKRLARETIALRRRVSGEDAGALASDRNALGLILVRSGEFDEAVAELREALRLMGEAHAEDHTFIGQINNNLGWALGTDGRWAEAARYFEAALARYEGVFAPDHPNVLTAKANLCRSLQLAGEVEAAEALHREVIAGMRTRFGEGHVNVAHAKNNYALMLEEDRGEPLGAAELYLQALTIYRERLGPDHPYCAIALHNTARALARGGERERAERACREALDLRRRTLRTDHPDVARSEHLLGKLLLERGDAAGAESHLEEALRIRRDELGEGHGMTASSMLELGLCRLALGRATEARELIAPAREALAASQGGDHPGVARADEALAGLGG